MPQKWMWRKPKLLPGTYVLDRMKNRTAWVYNEKHAKRKKMAIFFFPTFLG